MPNQTAHGGSVDNQTDVQQKDQTLKEREHDITRHGQSAVDAAWLNVASVKCVNIDAGRRTGTYLALHRASSILSCALGLVCSIAHLVANILIEIGKVTSAPHA